MRVMVPGPGTIVMRGSIPVGSSSSSRTAARTRAVTACTARRVVTAAGTVVMTCRLNAAAQAARTRKAVRLRLAATFTGTSGGSQASVRVVTLPRMPARLAVTG